MLKNKNCAKCTNMIETAQKVHMSHVCQNDRAHVHTVHSSDLMHFSVQNGMVECTFCHEHSGHTVHTLCVVGTLSRSEDTRLQAILQIPSFVMGVNYHGHFSFRNGCDLQVPFLFHNRRDLQWPFFLILPFCFRGRSSRTATSKLRMAVFFG